MIFRVGDLVKPIGRSLIIADYDISDNTITLLTEYNTVIEFPARASPFFMEPRPVFSLPYEEMMGERGQTFHLEEEDGTRFEMILDEKFETTGRYYLQSINSPAGLRVCYAKPYGYVKPDSYHNWIQTEIDCETFTSKIVRLFTNPTNSDKGERLYHDQVDDDTRRKAEAALITKEGFMWWSPLVQLENINNEKD